MSYVDKVTAAEILSKKLNIPLYDLADIFAEIPEADVETVVRGEWKIESVAMSDELPVMFEQYVARCSVCGRKEYIGILSNEKEGIKKAQEKYPYCNCGADMRSNNAERISETE